MTDVRALLTTEQRSRVALNHQKVKSIDAQVRALDPTVAAEKSP